MATGEELLNVTSLAVWGSLASSFLLASYLLVQAVVDKVRRSRFVCFGAICGVIAFADYLYPHFDPMTYEIVRVALWTTYCAILLWLFALSPARIAAVAGTLVSVAALVWNLWNPALTTTFVIPPVFAVAAFAHGRHFRANHGYASCGLMGYSAVLALMCSLYYLVISTGQADVIGLGYLHYALISAQAVVFGWVHLPRELRGLAPVKVSARHASLFVAALLLGEGAVQASLLIWHSSPPTLYIAGTLFQIGASLLFFFHHRHLLVIYTDNVTQLLEERTASLRAAQTELARQNEVQAEKLMEQAREIQAKAEVIDRQRRLELAAQTAGQAAHDIQNLLSPITVHLDSLEQERENPMRVSSIARTVRKQVDDLLGMSGQMLALSRRGRIERFPIALDELANEVRARFPGEQILIEGHPGWVTGTWAQLLRVLVNLVTNALESGPGRTPRVTLRFGTTELTAMRSCHLGFLSPGKYGYIEVADNGDGIPVSLIDRIFEPFFSSKSTSYRSGSGLGLSIVAAVVDDHGGVLDLTTGSAGTCFTIYLPACDAPAAHVPEESLCGNETVIVIDNDSAILEQYEALLERAGYFVITARSGAEALRILQLENADLAILDLHMPERGGLETLYQLLQLRPHLRAIIHSGFASAEEESSALALGAAAVLRKPVEQRELLRTLRQTLNRAVSVAA